MGSGYHGGFGNTRGAISAGNIASATSTFIGQGPGEALKKFLQQKGIQMLSFTELLITYRSCIMANG